MNMKRYGELNFKVSNISYEGDVEAAEKGENVPIQIHYDVSYWDRTEHRTTYIS